MKTPVSQNWQPKRKANMNTETKTAMVMLNVAKLELGNIEASHLASLSSAIALATKQVNEVFAGQLATAQEKVRSTTATAVENASKCLPRNLKNEEVTLSAVRDLLAFCAGVVGFEVVYRSEHVITPTIRYVSEPFEYTIFDVKAVKGELMFARNVYGHRKSWQKVHLCPSYTTTQVMVRKIRTEEEKRIQKLEEARRRQELQAKLMEERRKDQ